MDVTAEEMYEVVGELFGTFMDNPKMVQTAKKTNAALRYRFTNPTVTVTIDSRKSPGRVWSKSPMSPCN